MMFIWIFIIGVLVYWFFVNERSISFPQHKKPIDELKSRLAKGEISIEEYQDLKDQIQK